MTLVIDNIAELITNDPELGTGPLGIVADASVVVDRDTVLSVGRAGAQADQRIDAGRRLCAARFCGFSHASCICRRQGRGVHQTHGR